MKIGKIAVAALSVAVLGVTGCAYANQTDYRGCVVEHKERLLNQGSSGEKRVHTTCGVFAVEDSLAGGFNSYDTYAQLTEGKAYDLRTGGYRVGLFSMFPTIIEAVEVAS